MAAPIESHPGTSELEGYIETASALYRIPHPERSKLWQERLALHLLDFVRISNAECGHEIEPIALPTLSKDRAATDNTNAPTDCRLWKIAQGVRSGTIDPVLRVEACLARIKESAHLNAFRHINGAGAQRQAAELRRRVERGEKLGPLAGVILAIKDCISVQDMPMTGGTRSLTIQTPAFSAPVVQSLQAADAIIIGTTTMHELAYGATTDNPHMGRVGNPIDPQLIAGGSSGGSAVAVALEMADAALGTDSAGSVRMPASLCGIVGFKPTYEALSRHGVIPLSWSLDHVGLLTKTAGDADFLFRIMAGACASTQTIQSEKKLRLALPTNYFFDPIEPSVKQAFDAAIDKLASAGLAISTTNIEDIELAPTMQFFTLCAEATQIHIDRALTNPDGLGDEVRVRLESGQFLRAVDYIKAQRLRSELRRALTSPLENGHDVLVTPTVLLPACTSRPFVNIQNQTMPVHAALTRCTLPFNLTGMPAISIPCGYTSRGLPVGLQIAGRLGHDAEVLQVATTIETLLRQPHGDKH